MKITEKNGWLIDESNNRCLIARFGSRENAEKALLSLKGCSGCSGCFGCSDCSRCSGCFDCFGCSDCSRCFGCSGCSDCSRCSGKNPLPSIPVIKNIHNVVYEAVSQDGALNMSNWHTCETTHCRAGWVVTLAGDAGKELERATSTAFAAMQIYKASGYQINPARFYDDNEKAMADMRALAAQERR